MEPSFDETYLRCLYCATIEASKRQTVNAALLHKTKMRDRMFDRIEARTAPAGDDEDTSREGIDRRGTTKTCRDMKDYSLKKSQGACDLLNELRTDLGLG